MTWIIIGAAIGFFVGGAIGTIAAPQRAQKIMDTLPEQLGAIRTAAEQAASEAEAAVRRRSQRSRGRRRRRSRRRRGRG
jgi:gas vesicle protein